MEMKIPSGAGTTLGKDIVLARKTGFLINIIHGIAATIEEFDESKNGVILPFFLS